MTNNQIPRNKTEDYTESMAQERREFWMEKAQESIEHIANYSFEPSQTQGNIENFIGVAQVPIGLAGPLLVNGEHAQGEFYVPLATSEGTLVASYNRGMRLLRESGGVTVSVVDDAMQRAPVFVFSDAREARQFGEWVESNFEKIKAVAETTTSSGSLLRIEQYAVSRYRYLRFNYTTGDAAGQNMVGRATHAACEWIIQQYQNIERYILSGSIDTDKKHSHLNTLHSRGKRVVAEAVIPDKTLRSVMGVSAEQLFKARLVANTGAQLAGSINNGSHSANGITALFIATGQDVANVAESSSAIVVVDLTPNGDYYFSITIPSLIVATYGGGTGLPTQQECLKMLGCMGSGKVNKLAEIVGATVLCGELSLSSAVIAGDWVTSHEDLGRNR